MVHNKKAVIAAMGLFAALAGGNVSAVTMVTLSGTNVYYTFDEDALGLFGAASLSGDNLVFSPSNFKAASDGDLVADAAIHITVTANTGYQLSSFGLTESGSYSLPGNAFVDASGEFRVRDTDDPNTNFIPVEFGAVFNGAASTWTAGANVVLPSTGWGGVDGVVGSATLSISNLLVASTFDESVASITKGFVSVSAITAPIPEAQTYAMMLAGLGLLGFMARRRSIASA